MKRASLMLLVTACASAAAQKQPPASPAPPAAPAPAEVAAAPPEPPEPPAAPAPISVKPGECKSRWLSFTLARAVGQGSYITSLHCADARFTVTSDRATSDGREIKTAFQISPEEWEKAYQRIDGLGWRTFDDRCTSRELAQGRADGPVYRITIEEPQNKRSFICAGARDFAAPLDEVQTALLALSPPEPIAMGPSGVGVKACDEYLDRYEQCVRGKVPADKRAGFLDAIQFTRQAMHETLMRNPQGEEALARQCKEMHAAARSAMATFKCKM